MITLFHAPKSRSSRFLFLLEELNVPYRVEYVDIRRGDASGGVDPKNPHPHGKVPVISDDGAIVFESSAIALYLTDKFPEAGIGPTVGHPTRGGYLSWLAYYTGVFEPALVSKFMKFQVPVSTAGWVDADQVLPFVIRTLETNPYLLGERFSAVDVLFATTFALFASSPLLPKNAAIEAYTKRVTGRPAFALGSAKDAKPSET